MRNDPELSAAIDAVRAAGDAIVGHFGRERRVISKGPRELVTRSDIVSQEIIIDRLSRAYPSYGILSEEKDATSLRGQKTWVIDPLDGTHNFIFGIPLFGISVGLVEDGECVLGAVYFPLEKKLFSARQGRGAYRNGKKIRVSPNAALGKAVVAYDNRSHPSERAFRRHKRLVDAAFTTRILGSASRDLCFIAEGTLDARVFNKTHLYDVAAGSVILSEAGGRVTDFHGKSFAPRMTELVASNGRIHTAVLKALRGV